MGVKSSKRATTEIAKTMESVPLSNGSLQQPIQLQDRINGLLYGLHIGDAMAMPVHWFYDRRMLKQMFGFIVDYQSPPEKFPGSIMNLSNTGGGGRGSDKGNIVGDVILHGKRKYWKRGGAYHYHYGMKPGENTLEMNISRICLHEYIANNGVMDQEKVRNKYVQFMTTPGSHNDIYAATCHRMFFANLTKGIVLEKCPDNDAHNVDAIDGLVNLSPIIVYGFSIGKSKEAIYEDVDKTIGLFRDTKVLPTFGHNFANLLLDVLEGNDLRDSVQKAGYEIGVNVKLHVEKASDDPMVACYIDSSYPAMLYFAYKYANSFESAILASTNAGGENVARGALLGSLFGAYYGLNNIPERFVNGLVSKAEIEQCLSEFAKE